MASSIGNELEKQLECGICLERFEDPKMLPCQHTYCRKCVERLVTRAGPENYKVTCPECKRETKVPGGDVTKLQSNFLINRLLSIHNAGQSKASSLCEKHEGEVIKLFCETCDRSICRDCTIKDHRDHEYSFIKDIFPAEKEKIMNSVRNVSKDISVLKSVIENIQANERKVQESVTTVSQDVDAFIDQKIALLESKRKSLKQDLERRSTKHKKKLSDKKESLTVCLGCAESSVEFAEQVLAKRSEVEILSMKNQIIKQMTELNLQSFFETEKARLEMQQASQHSLRREAYELATSPEILNDESFAKMARIVGPLSIIK